MATPQPYQGHRSWNAWNVSLWIDSDEPLYRWAMSCIERANRVHADKSASRRLAMAMRLFRAVVGKKERTPDGAVYNDLCVKLALQDLMEG
jgi:hypothetical protein